jgi:hypothetical protein
MGAVLGSVCLGSLLSPAAARGGLSWRGVLRASGALSLAVGAAIGGICSPPALKQQLPQAAAAPLGGVEAGERSVDVGAANCVVTRTAAEAACVLARSGRLWLVIASTACLGPAFDLGALLPLYLAQTHQLTPAVAAVLSGAYPVRGLLPCPAILSLCRLWSLTMLATHLRYGVPFRASSAQRCRWW